MVSILSAQSAIYGAQFIDRIQEGSLEGGSSRGFTSEHAPDMRWGKSVEALCWLHNDWALQAETCGVRNRVCWESSNTLAGMEACYIGGNDSCVFANDAVCDEGRDCDIGTDCTDCANCGSSNVYFDMSIDDAFGEIVG